MFRWLPWASLFLLALWRRKQPQTELYRPDHDAKPTQRQQPVRPPEPAQPQGWHPQEEKHRRREGWYWFASVFLSTMVAVGAGLSARYAYQAAEAGRIQAQAAQGQLDQMTAAQRPWVLTSELSIERVDILPDIAAIMASTNYKVTNFGQSPAMDVFVTTALFIEGLDAVDKSAIRALCKPHPVGSELFLYFYRYVMASGKVEEIFGFPIQNGVFAREIRSLEKRGITKVDANFVLGGCITYKFLGSDILHETGFAIRAQDARVRVVGHITEFDSVEIGKRGAIESQKFLLAPDASLGFAN